MSLRPSIKLFFILRLLSIHERCPERRCVEASVMILPFLQRSLGISNNNTSKLNRFYYETTINSLWYNISFKFPVSDLQYRYRIGHNLCEPNYPEATWFQSITLLPTQWDKQPGLNMFMVTRGACLRNVRQ